MAGPQSTLLLRLFAELEQCFAPTTFAEEEELLPSAQRQRKEHVEELFIAISTLVGSSVLEKAFGYVDQITEHRARQSGRQVFWVKSGSSNSLKPKQQKDGDGVYRVLPVGFCTCKSFQEMRVGTAQPLCKHIVAVYLARAQHPSPIRVEVHDDAVWGSKAW